MGIFSSNKEKNKEINQDIQNIQEGNNNNENTPEHNLTTQNNEQHSNFQSIEKEHENNNLNNISLNMEKNDKINEVDDSVLLSKKRIREDNYYPNESNNFSFKKNNNSQNIVIENEKEEVMKQIEEEKAKLNELLKKLESYKKIVANEIDRTIINGQENNININMNRQDIQKTIRNIMETSIKQNEDIKQIECIYKSLNPNSQITLQKRLEKIEEKLNDDTYLKTQIIKNKKTDINPLSKLKENKEEEKKIQLIEIKEVENEKEENNKQNEKKNMNVGEQKNEKNLNKNKNNIKIDDIKIDDTRKSLNLQNHIKINDFNDYSFKCLTTNLNFSIYKGTSEVKFKLKLENNGSFPWPKNQTTLSTDRTKSNIKIKEIILDPLNPGISCDFDALFRNMSQLSEGKYYSNLEFKVCGKKYGNNILINVEILEDKKKKYEPVINVVRDEYLLDKNKASDTIIAEGIDKTKTIEGAFNYIVEKNSKHKNK